MKRVPRTMIATQAMSPIESAVTCMTLPFSRVDVRSSGQAGVADRSGLAGVVAVSQQSGHVVGADPGSPADMGVEHHPRLECHGGSSRLDCYPLCLDHPQV